MSFDATFWALIALIAFFAVVVYFKVPGLVTKGLDDRADKIKSDLEEARKLREDAQQLLAEYQRKRKDAEAEASEIVAAAKREAAALREDAERKMADYVTRRTAQAEQKIAQAESQAMAEVKASAVDIAIEATRNILSSKLTGKASTDMFKRSLDEVKTRLN